MNCPVCETQMKEIEKYGVEIDIYPQCKGVWLDRGKIDKIATVESNYNNYEIEHHGKKGDRLKLFDFSIFGHIRISIEIFG